ncbi:hypothetical protein H072_2354 [Dactylellina haptotyla CBS 200.50]|uniref:NmrA-like domain-containing protein n=1 Tax=Dactylellina haptotyla (strain CBS 200.50) TaxID=1284197 RepID=S8ARL5_DACHA|nr:hypothetical protein H072_2354 [Dactylellina haptotyla CBS 200.50]
MSAAKVFTVFGSTGNQGGSIINAILSHPVLSKEYSLRGVTRNASSDKAKALTAKGVEMVSGDMEHYDSVSNAIKGSYAVFAVTNYWESPPSKEREVNQGKRIADACKEHDVKQLIWSNLPHVGKLSKGKYPNVHHFDGKAEVGEYIASLGIPHVNVVPGMFMSNLKANIKSNDGGETFTFSMPAPIDVKWPWFNPSRDNGNFVAGALLQPEIFNASNPVSISECSGFYSGTQMCKIFEEVTGKKINYFEIPKDMFIGFMATPEIGQELYENFMLVVDYGYFGPTVEEAQKGVEDSIEKFFLEGERPQGLEEYFKEKKSEFWGL